MKKVVFVGGSSYSGSTMLDLTLAHSPDGFSCGEVSRLFHPYKQHHFKFVCGCGDPRCRVWDTIKRAGPDRLYDAIFELFPSVNHVVDSSKDPLWIHERSQALTRSGVSVKNILIWKTPEEYRDSCVKRGLERRWESAWISYHKLYFRMVDSWGSVRCSDLITCEDTLRALCEYAGLAYFEGKHRYWEKVHHTAFGNHSAKRHLYGKGSEAYERSRNIQHSSFKKLADRERSEAAHQALVSQPSSAQFNIRHQGAAGQVANNILRVLESKRIGAGVNPSYMAGARDLPEMIERLKASKVHEFRRRARRDFSTRAIKAYLHMKNA